MGNAIFWQAIREYLRMRRLLPWLFFASICGALAAVWQFLQPDSSNQAQYAAVSSMLVFRLVALSSAIFTTAIVSQEVEQRTIVYLLTRPVPRWMLITIRYLASVIVVALVGILAALFASVGAFSGFGANELLMNDIKAIIVGAFAYGALFLFVSLLFNRAMLICLLFAFGWEAAVPNMRGMESLSVQAYLQAIAKHPSDPTQGGFVDFASGLLGTNAIATDHAWGVLIGMTVIFIGLSAWWFTHFEYVPREDAG